MGPILVKTLAQFWPNIGRRLRNFFCFVTEVHWPGMDIGSPAGEAVGAPGEQTKLNSPVRCRWIGLRHLLVVALLAETLGGR